MQAPVIVPSSRSTMISPCPLSRQNAMSSAGSFHGRVRPAARHSPITAASSPARRAETSTP
jgi:hypothetical protein